MAEKLSKIETLRSDFIANVSHEFKTPLATIQGYVTLLEDDKLTNEARTGENTTGSCTTSARHTHMPS